MATINSYAEQQAQNCLNHKFCESLNLQTIKQRVEKILSHVGDNGVFYEYTMHDISHVNGILSLYDKIIPETTKKRMTSADWLMIVLAAYFHDIGMVVTRAEFEKREENTDFVSFRDDKKRYAPIMSEISELSTENQDKFWYQEFVRYEHGNRAYNWIKKSDKYEFEPCAMIDEVLTGLDDSFRSSLALVCKSHTLDVLPEELHCVDEAYGTSDDEKVNLLYASVLLRTADLLHVTNDRTPSDEYRIILPQNKVSQLEWAKQKAVKSIDVKEETDENGNLGRKHSHSFIIQAKFNDAEGYFSFKDYVSYAQHELCVCKKWIQEEHSEYACEYLFPWDSIDTSRIKTEGFRNEKLKFEIDQKNILHLLTGHTLYNDSTVVLRELIQNAIDAGRLQDALEKDGSAYQSKVEIRWNTATRKLIIKDNATGMDSHTIANYLLRVGASKYQSDQFKKEHPDFHSISRFGIGLLTCFMICDDVDVYTLDAKEKKCYLLKIRNLHGEYLMREDADVSNILEKKHGTTFELIVREDIDMSKIESQIKHWILLPFSNVSLIIDDGQPIPIGYKSTQDALEAYARQLKEVELGAEFQVKKFEKDGVEMSCLLRKNPWTEVWSLYSHDNQEDTEFLNPTGICAEGIRVTDVTPGLYSQDIIAMVNCSGKNAPATNVARDALESGTHTDYLYKVIYGIYEEVLLSQKDKLEEKNTKLWAISELNQHIDFLYRHLLRSRLINKDFFIESVRCIENNVIDNGKDIQLISLDSFPSSISTLNCMAYKSAVRLLEDVHGASETAIGLLKKLDPKKISSNVYLSLDNMSSLNQDAFMDKYEVVSIGVSLSSHWIQLDWNRISKDSQWKHIVLDTNYHSYSFKSVHLFVCHNPNFRVKDAESYNAVVSDNCYFLLEGSSVYAYYMKHLPDCDKDDEYRYFLSDFIVDIMNHQYEVEDDLVERSFNNRRLLKDNVEIDKSMREDLLMLAKSRDLKIVNFSAFYHM